MFACRAAATVAHPLVSPAPVQPRLARALIGPRFRRSDSRSRAAGADGLGLARGRARACRRCLAGLGRAVHPSSFACAPSSGLRSLRFARAARVRRPGWAGGGGRRAACTGWQGGGQSGWDRSGMGLDCYWTDAGLSLASAVRVAPVMLADVKLPSGVKRGPLLGGADTGQPKRRGRRFLRSWR